MTVSGVVERGLSALLAEVAGEFDAVAARVGAVEVERRFGERRVALRFARGEVADALLPAFAPGGEGGGKPHASIDVWAGRGPVAAPWGFAEIGPGGLVRGGDGVVAVHDTYSDAVTLVDRAARRVLHRRREAAGLPWWERAAPLRAALYWALSEPGCHLVHAGAVGDDRGCALLAGAAGSGKTTVALAALDHGLGYLADDYVLLASSGDEPHAAALYRTASIRRVPDGRPKEVRDVAERSPGSLRVSLPVRAVIAPRIRGGAARLSALSPAETLRSLAPTTVAQFPFGDDGLLSALAALVRRVPCFRLDVGDDPAGLAAAVDEALERATR